MKILANDGLDERVAELLCCNGFSIDCKHYSREELLESIQEYDLLIVRSATEVDKKLINRASKLKLIIRAGVGIDNIDVKYAEKKGIMVKNTPNASSNSVAELVLGHMLGLSRYITISNVTMREGYWNKNTYTGIELSGKTLGIIGFGRIGRSLAQKAEALGMDIIFYDKYVTEDEHFKYKSLEEVLRNSDFISLHTPASNKPLIGKKEFDMMKDGVFIINAARGGIIDEKELLNALNSNKVAGAGLDVFKKEPEPNLELCNHPKVSCTPHIGAATEEAQIRINQEIHRLICDFVKQLKDVAI